MKTKFIVTGPISIKKSFKSKSSQIFEETINSIKSVLKDDETYDFCFYNEKHGILEHAINKKIEKKISLYEQEGYTHICLISNGSTIMPNFREIAECHVESDSVVYLPIVQYTEEDEKSKDKTPVFRGFLNTCVWKPYVVESLGTLTLDLAKKQIDTTLFGCFVPLKVVKKHKLKTKIKHYSFFEYFTRLASKNITIEGIPKVMLRHLGSDVLRKSPEEEKVRYFTACRHEYKHDEDRDIKQTEEYEEVIKAGNNKKS